MSPGFRPGKKRFKNRRKAGEDRRSENVTYIRFGDLPPGGCSEFAGVALGTRFQHLYRSGQGRERGVSVFEARRQADGSFVVPTPRRGSSGVRLRHLFLELALADRPLYEVKGTAVGKGANGEPLLSNCELTPIPNDVSVKLCPPKDRPFEGVEWWNRSRALS